MFDAGQVQRTENQMQRRPRSELGELFREVEVAAIVAA
jgi:hypothetical protein